MPINYYIVEDEYAAAGGSEFRYSILRSDGSHVFRAVDYEAAERLLKRLVAFTERGVR